MNPFRKEKIVGLPTSRDKNIYEKTPEQLKAMRVPKKEYGSDRMVTQLNEKINSGKNTGEYEEDPLNIELGKLEHEHWELNNRDDVRRFKKEKDNYEKTIKKVQELRTQIENSLESENHEDTDYVDKIQNLRGQEGISEYQKERFLMLKEKEIESAMSRISELENQMREIETKLKEKYGNQDIKTEQGQYLN